MLNRFAAFAASFSLALCTTVPAQAAADDAPKVAVHYADLDLKTVEGRARLEKRIEVAARELCGLNDALTTGSRVQPRSRVKCYETATSQIGESIALAVERRDNKG